MVKRLLLTAASIIICLTSSLHASGITKWALPSVSVVCIREEPRHGAELSSQVVMGTPIKLVEKAGEWWKVITPEGYTGYIIGNSIKVMSSEEMDIWRKQRRIIVCSNTPVYIYDNDSVLSAMSHISDIVDGAILSYDSEIDIEEGKDLYHVCLPDGRCGYIQKSNTCTIERWAMQEYTADSIPSAAMPLMGTPYLWGGTSTKSMDCSGFTKILFYRQGVILPRDASQQAKIGQPIDPDRIEEFHKGDLLFFGNPKTRRINHVAIYLSDGKYIHCSGRVKINSLYKSDPAYLQLNLLQVRRVDPETAQRLGAKSHSWYFSRPPIAENR